jgi:hypothetical protein
MKNGCPSKNPAHEKHSSITSRITLYLVGTLMRGALFPQCLQNSSISSGSSSLYLQDREGSTSDREAGAEAGRYSTTHIRGFDINGLQWYVIAHHNYFQPALPTELNLSFQLEEDANEDKAE